VLARSVQRRRADGKGPFALNMPAHATIAAMGFGSLITRMMVFEF
jgi:hypothetical protein